MKSTQEQRLYWVWAAMIQRCHNPANRSYARYGGRGIHVCNRWRSWSSFRADMGLPAPGLSLERRDNSLGYSPDNCVWATRGDQNNNRPSFCISVEVAGHRLTLKQAWRKFASPGLSYRSVHKRISRGWDASRALGLSNGVSDAA